MSKFLRYTRAGFAVAAVVLIILAVWAPFYPLQIFDVQLTPLLQRIVTGFSVTALCLFSGLILLTLVFGRIYCSTLCPLGLYQEFLMLIFRRKRKNFVQKNYPYKYFLAALFFGILLGGSAYVARLSDPYTLFVSAGSGAWYGLGVLLCLALLVWFKGRFFCSNVCPVGTVLGLIAKFSLFKMYIKKDHCAACGLCASKCPTGSIDFKNHRINNETCIKCFNCLSGCRKNSLHYGLAPAEKVCFSPNRRKLLLGGAAMALFAVAVKDGKELVKIASAKVKKAILPAGAESAEKFSSRCLNCNLCVQSCPMKIIKKADKEHATVHIEYDGGYCDYNCCKCSQVCPSGALKRLTLAEKQKTQIALASTDEEICISCGFCAEVCPRQAITLKRGEFPKFNPDICIGCGKCKSVCPVKAISVKPL
ncbi:MAG: 4Fe-4S binding protein [Alphaproteobacteria bacterium]|mgnify:CR=1 FL=1|nr:4Fe-4S binding protein [Alphaproteobacteria bacterium]MDY4690203.1 4Fe-4S binding protein [Alphaproteobacteria bacterium]